MSKQRGLTLVELMIVLSIAAILVTLAAPSLTAFTKSSAITSGVNSFMADLRFARSEAIRLGGKVIMCRSNAPESATPACGTGTGPGGNGWVSGWIIFHDLDDSGTRTTGDVVLRVQSPITTINSIVELGSSSSTKFRLTATGRLTTVASATTITFGGNPDFSNDQQRVLCVSLGGRARIAGTGTASCGTDGE